MKKLFMLGALLIFCLQWSCDKQEDSIPAAPAADAVIVKTPKMKSFEGALVNVSGKLQRGEIAYDEAVQANVAIAKQYLTDNGVVIDESATGDELIIQSLDLHLQKVNELRTNKNLTP